MKYLSQNICYLAKALLKKCGISLLKRPKCHENYFNYLPGNTFMKILQTVLLNALPLNHMHSILVIMHCFINNIDRAYQGSAMFVIVLFSHNFNYFLHSHFVSVLFDFSC